MEGVPLGLMKKKPGKDRGREAIHMNQVVGSRDILFVCLDTLRYDVAAEQEAAGTTPVLNQYGPWRKCQAPGNFTYPSHQAMFAGFLPCDYDASNVMDRELLFFPKNIGMGKSSPPDAFAFEGGTFVEGLEREGYETFCIGGVAFFDKRSDLGRVMPSYFKHSYWNPSFGCQVKDSAKNQIDFAIKKLKEVPEEKRVFLYINIDAIHYPNYFYVEGEKQDSVKTHAAALRYVDRELERLFAAFSERGPAFVICCSDHGTCYGEDGVIFHGVNHPVVNTIPYKHFFLEDRREIFRDPSRLYTQYMYSYPHKTAYRPLDNVRFSDYASALDQGEAGLYLHLPFCQARCGYCNLFSSVGMEGDIDGYLEACERQASQYGLKKGRFSDFTVGGGTPLLLTPAQLERMFCLAEPYLRQGASVTVETSPNQTEPGKLSVLKSHRVTRVSMGVQSFREEELKALGRIHTPDKARKALEFLKEADFPCLNLDLIYGIPGQTKESFLATVEEALAWEPEELFCYPLYVKQGTEMGRRGRRPSDQTFLLYETARDRLREAGYTQVSMRCFVKGSLPDNGEGCGFGSVVALGCGGRSYLGKLHFCVPYSTDPKRCGQLIRQFIEKEDHNSIDHGFLLGEEEQRRRLVIRNLFFGQGVRDELCQDFPLLEQWEREGFIRRKDGYTGVTDTGMALSDYLGPQLISPRVEGLMEEWRRQQ